MHTNNVNSFIYDHIIWQVFFSFSVFQFKNEEDLDTYNHRDPNLKYMYQNVSMMIVAIRWQ
jgi:hypothetical protein